MVKLIFTILLIYLVLLHISEGGDVCPGDTIMVPEIREARSVPSFCLFRSLIDMSGTSGLPRLIDSVPDASATRLNPLIFRLEAHSRFDIQIWDFNAYYAGINAFATPVKMKILYDAYALQGLLMKETPLAGRNFLSFDCGMMLNGALVAFEALHSYSPGRIEIARKARVDEVRIAASLFASLKAKISRNASARLYSDITQKARDYKLERFTIFNIDRNVHFINYCFGITFDWEL